MTDVGPNDVLMGRGAPFLNYEGNRRFRGFATTLRASYRQADKNRMKSDIATKLYHHVVDSGGRFLKCVREPEPTQAQNVVSSMKVVKTWREVKAEVALEKCKQTLRDRDPRSRGSRGAIAMQREHQLRAIESPAPMATQLQSTFRQGQPLGIPPVLPENASSQVQLPFGQQQDLSSLLFAQGLPMLHSSTFPMIPSTSLITTDLIQQAQHHLMAVQQLQQYEQYLTALRMQQVSQIPQQHSHSETIWSTMQDKLQEENDEATPRNKKA